MFTWVIVCLSEQMDCCQNPSTCINMGWVSSHFYHSMWMCMLRKTCWPWYPPLCGHHWHLTDYCFHSHDLVFAFLSPLGSLQVKEQTWTHTHTHVHTLHLSFYTPRSTKCLVWVLLDKVVLLKNVMSKSNLLIVISSLIVPCMFFSYALKVWVNVFCYVFARLAEINSVKILNKAKLQVAKVNLPWKNLLDTNVNTPHIVAPCLIR